MAHLINPILVHVGLPPLPDDVINSIGSGSGAFAADKLTKRVRGEIRKARERRRKSEITALRHNLLEILTRGMQTLTSGSKKIEVRQLITRLDERGSEWSKGFLSNQDMSVICTDIYVKYLLIAEEDMGQGLTPRIY